MKSNHSNASTNRGEVDHASSPPSPQHATARAATPSVKIDELVSKLVALEGSDLHLMVNAKPTVRVHGLLQPLEGYEVLRPADTEQILKQIIPKKILRDEFEEEGEADFSYEVYGVGRFRVNGVNAFRQDTDIMPLCAC